MNNTDNASLNKPISQWLVKEKLQTAPVLAMVNVYRKLWKNPPCYQWETHYFYGNYPYSSYVELPEGRSNQSPTIHIASCPCFNVSIQNAKVAATGSKVKEFLLECLNPHLLMYHRLNRANVKAAFSLLVYNLYDHPNHHHPNHVSFGDFLKSGYPQLSSISCLAGWWYTYPSET